MKNFRQYKLAKFYPFQPKLDENGNNPHVDLESQSIHQVLDPEGQIYKETIPFVERVRKVLLGLKNPTKEFLKEKGVVAWNVRQLLSLSQLEYLSRNGRSGFKERTGKAVERVRESVSILEEGGGFSEEWEKMMNDQTLGTEEKQEIYDGILERALKKNMKNS